MRPGNIRGCFNAPLRTRMIKCLRFRRWQWLWQFSRVYLRPDWWRSKKFCNCCWIVWKVVNLKIYFGRYLSLWSNIPWFHFSCWYWVIIILILKLVSFTYLFFEQDLLLLPQRPLDCRNIEGGETALCNQISKTRVCKKLLVGQYFYEKSTLWEDDIRCPPKMCFSFANLAWEVIGQV